MSADGRGPAGLRLSRWTREQLEAGSWVRRMFAEGQRLRALHGDDAVVDLALGQPLAEPSEAVRAALTAAASERGRERFGYMPNLGYPKVRERAAADVGYPGVGADCVAMTGGAAAAMCLALRAFVDPGDEVVGIAPHFGEYHAYCATAGATWVPVPARDDLGIDVDAVAAALTEHTAALILNSPCNPTGHVVDVEELHALAGVLERHAARGGRRILMLVDEVYRRLAYLPARVAEPLALYPWTVLARSFSKDLGLAGERIGYLAVHPVLASTDVMRGLELAQRALGFVNAPATMQRMLLHLESWDVDVAAHLERRDHAVASARAAGLEVGPPQGGLYLWARSPWPDSLAFVSALAERRVLVAPGIAFGDPGALRICFTVSRIDVERAMAVIGELTASPVRI